MTSWSRWCPKSPASRLFAQPFVVADQRKPRHWPLWSESTGDLWTPHKGPITGKMSPFHAVIMLCSIHFATFKVKTLPVRLCLPTWSPGQPNYRVQKLVPSLIHSDYLSKMDWVVVSMRYRRCYQITDTFNCGRKDNTFLPRRDVIDFAQNCPKTSLQSKHKHVEICPLKYCFILSFNKEFLIFVQKMPGLDDITFLRGVMGIFYATFRRASLSRYWRWGTIGAI